MEHTLLDAGDVRRLEPAVTRAGGCGSAHSPARIRRRGRPDTGAGDRRDRRAARRSTSGRSSPSESGGVSRHADGVIESDAVDRRGRQLVSEPRRRQRRARRREADSRPAAAAASAANAPAERVIWGSRLLSRAAARRLGAGRRDGRGRRLRRARDLVRRAAAPAGRAGADAGARRRRVRGGPRRAAADDARRVAGRRRFVDNAAACSTPPATIETACCWRR